MEHHQLAGKRGRCDTEASTVSVAVLEHADGDVASLPRHIFADREFLASLIGQTLSTIEALAARAGLTRNLLWTTRVRQHRLAYIRDGRDWWYLLLSVARMPAPMRCGALRTKYHCLTGGEFIQVSCFQSTAPTPTRMSKNMQEGTFR
jgi:hypothetical protein